MPVPQSTRVLRSCSAIAASDNNEDDEDMLADQDEEDEGINATIMFSLLVISFYQICMMLVPNINNTLFG